MNEATSPDNSASFVYASRLNSVLGGIWRIAPVMERTQQLREEKKLELKEATDIAMQEVEIPELPQCIHSDNEDGKTNISWYGSGGMSCMYTVDAEGLAVCEEYADENLDLSNYEHLLGVAATIYCDITRTSREAAGVNFAILLYENEPEWQD